MKNQADDQLPGQMTIWDFLPPDINTMPEAEAVGIIADATGISFEYNPRWKYWEGKAGRVRFTLAYSRYTEDGRLFMSAGYSAGTSGGGAPCDTIGQTISWIEAAKGKTEQPKANTPEEPAVGEWVTGHGAIICHIMRRGYIGKKVVVDKSTKSKEFYRVGILEDYFENEGVMRSVVYTGGKQRELIDHFPGVEIFEPLPWDCYEKRNKVIYKDRREKDGDKVREGN